MSSPTCCESLNSHSDLLPHASLLLSLIPALSSPNPSTCDSALKTFTKTLDHYLQLPPLLDPLLSSILTPLLELCKSALPNLPTATTFSLRRPVATPFIALYSLAKVRGPKPLSRHLPHTVPDLHLLLDHLPLAETHPSQQNLWHVRYILYLWLSVAIRVPFPLHSIIPKDQLNSIIKFSQTALSVSGPVSTAAAAFLARLLSRRDAADARHEMVAWAIEGPLADDANDVTKVAGLSFLAAFFKYAHRDDARKYVDKVLERLVRGIEHGKTWSTTREAHLVVKLAVRLGLSVLPPRLAAWRYQRGERIVFEKKGGEVRRKVEGIAGHLGDVEDEELEDEVEEEGVEVVEGVVEIVLMGLAHGDTVVRWSAAKGVGRVTGRLPVAFAGEVVEGVLRFFEHETEVKKDAAWHGGCLAVAELVRRGLLLPGEEQFGRAFAVIGRAAAFDMRKGANSVGAHVRDAACYAVWAIARAYSKKDVEMFGKAIMEFMLPVALLDREINCRRAAAAAVQECVGRLGEGLFKDGIRLVTIADYFSLGDRVAAYLKITPVVATMAGGMHFDCILMEVSTRKLIHWDPVIRTLASKALAALIDVDKENTISTKVIPELLLLSTKRGDMVVRHGAVLGLAEAAKVLGVVGLNEYGEDIRNIPRVLKDRKLFSGRTGNEMRLACCHLIECMAIGAGDLYNKSEDCRKEAMYALQFLESIFGAGKEEMYSKATSAYAALCDNVISADPIWHDSVTKRILDGLSKHGASTYQRGFSLAAGVCGDSNASEKLVEVLCREVLNNKDVEVRRNSAISLRRIPARLIVAHLMNILSALTVGMNDYATDTRGDIGSWVREASMRSTAEIVENVFGVEPSVASELEGSEVIHALQKALEAIVQQCCGRIDRTRAVAGSALITMCKVFAGKVRNSKLVTLCKAIAECIGMKTSDMHVAEIVWPVDFAETESVFPVVRKLLDITAISDAVLVGLVTAGGGMGHQSKAALDSLVQSFREEGDGSRKQKRLGVIAKIIADGNERLTIPAFLVLQTLAKERTLDDMDKAHLIALVSTIRQCWKQKLRIVKRTASSVQLLGDLASLSLDGYRFDFAKGTLGRECLEALAVVLGTSIPRLRRITAECIYMILIEFAVQDDEELDEYTMAGFEACPTMKDAIDVVLDTEWEQLTTLAARERRNLLCKLLHIRAPSAIVTAAPASPALPISIG